MIGGLIKFESENIGGNNFSLWNMKVEDLLVQNDQSLALKGVTKKLSGITNEDWISLDKKEISTI